MGRRLPKYTRDQVSFKALADCTPDERSTFIDGWVKTMYRDRDNEYGPDAVAWLNYNAGTFEPGGPHLTMIGWLRHTPVVTATFTPDDHDTAKKLGLNCLGLIGLVNTHPDHRNMGLCNLTMGVICGEAIQPWVDAQDLNVVPSNGYEVDLFTWPTRVRAKNFMRESARRHGFVEEPQLIVGEGADYETIWRRYFRPTVLAM